MLTVRNLSFSYGRRPILHGIHAHVPAGALMAILGPNGSGKSTLLRCLLGLLPVPPGVIFFDNTDLTTLSVSKRAQLFAYIPQDTLSTARLTVFDTVLLGRKPFFKAYPHSRDIQRTEMILDDFGLSSLALRTMDTLSGGQRQMVWVAKAICQDSPLVFLDEPTSSLDIRHTLETGLLLRKLVELGKTVVLISHDLALCRKNCSHFLLLQTGRIIAQGGQESTTPEALAQLYNVDIQLLRELL